MASSHELRSIEDFIEPIYLEIKPISLKNMKVPEHDVPEHEGRGLDLLGDLLKEEFKVSYMIMGLKQDPKTQSEEKVANEATNTNTNYYRKERKLGVLGERWVSGTGHRDHVRWQFGVAYVAVESDRARTVKEKLEGHGFDGSIVHVKELLERPDNFIPQNWAKSASVV